MAVNASKEIIHHLMNIENQLNALNLKIDNLLGVEELSVDELKELDSIEEAMERGIKISLSDIE
ncbi:MAG: hypothetical protein OIN89_08085 [Candidatus Methanoperedens sp.]|jgi:hypothetical protein|nr:hypothetical protein [Candidatus Methanoperedens sp.]PKL53430.1 MAG: hypothetical protein CVV36_07130 [Candidatus Methanoperedenaceae archaeon HGW-Methanoperedenaceae-1]